MKKERFSELLINPGTIDLSDLEQLQQTVNNFPYFQDAHLLLLYGLHFLSSEKFENQLKISSLFLASRAVLVEAIMHGWPATSVTAGRNSDSDVASFAPGEAKITETHIVDLSVTDHELSQSVEIILMDNTSETSLTEEIVSFSLEDTVPIEVSEKKEDEEAVKAEGSPELLDFDLSNSSQPEDEPKEDLVDYFLRVNPRIVPRIDLEDTRGDISEPALQENDEIVTETLADIYEQQGHLLKAKQAYEKLILKYPEKKAYFATRIEDLDKRI